MTAPVEAPVPGTCRSCEARVYWARYERKDGTTGVMPVDVEPSERGRIQLFRSPSGAIRAVIMTRKQAENVRAAAAILGTEVILRVAHWATCPTAAEHRRAQ